MRKTLSGVIGGIVVLTTLLFVAPKLIDLNSYKSKISQKIRNLTGFELIIDGNIQVSFLPVPTLIAKKISLINSANKYPEIAQLKALEIRVDLLPLLAGKIIITAADLIEPIISMRVQANGEKNWILQPITNNVSNTNEEPLVQKPLNNNQTVVNEKSETKLAIRKIKIKNGTIRYSNLSIGKTEKLTKINATVAIDNAIESFTSEGKLEIRQMPFNYSFAVNKESGNNTRPLNLKLRNKKTKLLITGMLSDYTANPRFIGKINVSGQELGKILPVKSADNIMKGFFLEPFEAGAKVDASANEIMLKSLNILVEKQNIAGNVSIKFDAHPVIKAVLSTRQIDIDRMLQKKVPSRSDKQKLDKLGSKSNKTDVMKEEITDATKVIFHFPKDLSASIRLRADTIKYRDEVVRNCIFNAQLESGEVTIDQLSAQMPGATDVALFGFLTFKNYTPVFKGNVEVQSGDARSALKWSGLSISSIPPDRLRKLNFKSNISLNIKDFRITNAELIFDSSRVVGNAIFAVQKRLSFGASIIIDKLNLDGYFKKDSAENVGKKKSTGKSKKTLSANENKTFEANGAHHQNYKMFGDIFSKLLLLKKFDANINIKANSLIYREHTVKNVYFDGLLHNGNLEIRHFKIPKFGSLRTSVKGQIKNIGSELEIKDLNIKAHTNSIRQIFKFLNIPAPIYTEKLKKTNLTATLNGDIQKLGLKAQVGIGDTKVQLSGHLEPFNKQKLSELAVRITDQNFNRMLRRFNFVYQPRKKVGQLKIAAILRVQKNKFVIKDLNGNLGQVDLQGDVLINLSDSRPYIDWRINAGDVNINSFLPKEKTAGLTYKTAYKSFLGHPNLKPLNNYYTPAAVSKRWSQKKVDLSIFEKLDMDIATRINSIRFNDYQIEKFKLEGGLKTGHFFAKQFKGKIFGGDLAGKADLNVTRGNKLGLQVSIKNLSINSALQAVKKTSTLSGQFSGNADVTGNISSVNDLMSSISGQGKVDIKNINIVASKKKIRSPVGVLGLVTEFSKLGSLFLGQKRREAQVNLTSSYSINKGTIIFPKVILNTGVGAGEAIARVNIPTWMINASGSVSLKKSIARVFLPDQLEKKSDVPFKIQGSLDNPRVEIDLKKISINTVPNVADKLLKKKLKGANKLLKKIPTDPDGILGGILGKLKNKLDSSSRQLNKNGESKKLNPEKLLQELLKF